MSTATSVIPHESTGLVWFDRARQWLARFPLSILQLGMRIGVGAVFFKAGLLKYNSPEFTVLLFRDEYQVPLLALLFPATFWTVRREFSSWGR